MMMKLRRIAFQISAIGLCLIGGTGALNALVANPIAEESSAFSTFKTVKESQLIVNDDDRWSVLATGDIMLSRFVAAVLERESFEYPYDDIRGIVSNADLAIANFENPVGPGRKMPHEGLVFRADPQALPSLKEAGFDVLGLANNHMSDNGERGIETTVELLKKEGFLVAGAGANEERAREPAIAKIGDHTIALLSYGDPRFLNQVHFATDSTPGIARADAEDMKHDVREARKSADIVIIALHAGAEYRDTPDSAQQKLLDDAAAAGADIVLGHHPHVIQPLEKNNAAWVIDSLGNLIFDQMWSEETRLGMMLRFVFNGKEIQEIEAIPVQIFNNAQPRIAVGEAWKQSLEKLKHPYEQATVLQWHGDSFEPLMTHRAMPLRQKNPMGVRIQKTLRDNLHENRIGETYALSGGTLTVLEGGDVVWKNSEDTWVQDVWIGDIDGDREREVIVSMWKADRRGTSKDVKNHVGVYGFEDDSFVSLWESDPLPRAQCEIALADVNGDGTDELIALEGTYAEDFTCEGRNVTLSQWTDGDLENVRTSEDGAYWNLRLEPYKDGVRAIVNGLAK